MFTEPADQSVWWYHQFLLTWAGEGATGRDTERYEDILRTEASTLKELIEVEGRCKVGVLKLYLVMYKKYSGNYVLHVGLSARECLDGLND